MYMGKKLNRSVKEKVYMSIEVLYQEQIFWIINWYISPLSMTESLLVVSNSLQAIDRSPPGSSIHGILQARMLECIAVPFSRGSMWFRDWTQVSCTAGRFFTIWATREAPSEG